jgi:hypothetical protein
MKQKRNHNIIGLFIGVDEFKTCYQPKTNSVEDRSCALLAESNNGLNW